MIPAGYPWTDEHVGSAVVLRWGPEGWTVDPEPGDVRGRTPVAAVGSNASPVVLVRKLAGLGRGEVFLEPRRLPGVRVGHSAHVSLGGYVPAAPFVAAGDAQVVVGWFDSHQLRLLDATEPNYLRRRLDAGVDLYVSRWGVVAVEGVPLPLTTQDLLMARLRPPAVVAGGWLGDPAVAAQVSAWLQAEHAVDAGWPA